MHLTSGCRTWKGGSVWRTKVTQEIDSGDEVQESRSPDSYSCKTGYKSNAKITNIHHKELTSWVAQVIRRTALERKQRSWTPLIWDPVFLSPIPDLLQLGWVFPSSLFFLWPSLASVISISCLSLQGAVASAACTSPSPHISCQAPSGKPMGFAILRHQASARSVMNPLQHFLP